MHAENPRLAVERGGTSREFFMSITYPTIFALGIRGLGEPTKLRSSQIVMAIIGRAIMPFMMDWLADTYAMRIGFVMPLICFL